ncbi:aldolase/citrate lyase family protein [Lichenifustis flavocetrariae]|uniref:Aldolase/citrate lyase family protein n=1 Tax=Lichenifustis flavocetrariae TaxID=2949735 RepID=A0AA42CJ50_9HYPH|nr:aldolase/citrate lyase family protein [Lichenifustis flavocetrariae]MCW6507621.1 aldolase/citrate lyase family protein [Lichenifustis flavocetrariae]
MRSVLVVPVTDPKALDAAFAAAADAIVLDLVTDRKRDPTARVAVRRTARDILRAAQIDAHRPHLYVRLEGLDEDAFDDDLSAVMIGEPDGILLAGSRSGIDVQHLGAKLAVQEAEYGLTDGETGVIAEAGASARALFTLASYDGASARLVGLTWHAERLALDLGSDHDVTELADFAPFQTVRHLTLFAARAAEVAALDTASAIVDETLFLAECQAARRHGFNAKLTTSPSQVAIINAVFSRDPA